MLRLTTFLLVVACSGSAVADVRWGIRGGVTIDPESLAVGGFAAIDRIPDLKALKIEPGLDIGIGEEGTLDYFFIRAFAHAKYIFQINNSPLRPFPLLGLEIMYINFETGLRDTDDTNIGLNLGGGVEYRDFALSLYFGAGDVPDLNLIFAYSF